MNAEQVLVPLVTVTLVVMMAETGLRVTLGELAAVARDRGLISRALLANYALVPAATVVLLALFAPHPHVAAGFLILAVCPGAPFGPPLTAIAGGSVPVAAGLMLLLAGTSALLAPLLLSLLLGLLPAREPLAIDSARIALSLLLTQLLPLATGVALRARFPAFAARLAKPARLASGLLSLAAVGLVLALQGEQLAEIRLRGIFGMLLLLVCSLAAGALLGGRRPEVRKAVTVTTAVRNAGVAMVIASGDFAGTPALTAVTAYLVVTVIGGLIYAKLASRRPAAAVQPAP